MGGFLLIAVSTSLPELSTVIASVRLGRYVMAVSDIFCTNLFNGAMIFVVDVFYRGGLALNEVGSFAAFAALLGVVVSALFATYLASVWILTRSQGRRPWVARGPAQGEGESKAKAEARHNDDKDRDRLSLRALVLRIVGGAAVILVAGVFLSKTGEAIATQTGLGQNMGGYLLVAISTSLPELSTVIASVRLGRYVMAVSDIFGTNLFNGAMIFVVDIFYRGGLALNEVGPFAAFAALLGIVVSALFLIGLLERRDRTVLRMGYDSFAALLVYFGGTALLFQLQ
jgi:cation:H+ antiporter